MAPNLQDGNVVQADYTDSGLVKLRITPDDDIGHDGQFYGNVGGVMQMTDLPSSSSNATIDFQRFNSSGTWTKPLGLNANSPVLIRGWPGGGSGRLGSGGGGGGGGGGYTERWCVLSDMGVTETVTIGAGGPARVGSSANGASGGSSTLGSLFSATGVGGGGGPGGGFGGGPIAGLDILSAATPVVHGQGSPGGSGSATGGIWHGGGGGADSGASGINGANSIYGGGGGAGASSGAAGTAGTSQNAGNGGAAGFNGASGTAGQQPAGGGGGAENTGGASSGAGGPGRIDVIVFGFPA
jgi:hypothetical protein